MFLIAEVTHTGGGYLDWVMGIWMVFVVVCLVWFGVSRLSLFLVSRRTLKRAEKALDEGRLADALRMFRMVAMMEFHKIGVRGGGSERFDDGMLGIETTYSRAGKTVDLQPLRELHADLKALYSDKKYRSASASAHDGYLTKVGIKIRDRIISEACTAFEKLPSLDT